jgi:hypothetical protein
MHFSSSYAGSDTIPHYISNVRFSEVVGHFLGVANHRQAVSGRSLEL